MVWFPILASFAAIVPLVLIAIGYVMMGRREERRSLESQERTGR